MGGSLQTAESTLDDLRRVAHPNLLRLSYCGVREGLAFTVTNPVETISFQEYLSNKGGKLDPELALDLLLPVGQAIALLHKSGFVHGSISPTSIRVEATSERAVLSTIDLCTVLKLDRPALSFRELGSRELYSPEAANREQRTVRTDTFLWAAVLHQALTGKNAPTLAKSMGRDPQSVLRFTPPSQASSLPPEVDSILLSALSASPRERPENVQALMDQLAPLKEAVAELGRQSRTRTRGPSRAPLSDSASAPLIERRQGQRRRTPTPVKGDINPLDAFAEWIFEIGTVGKLVLFFLFVGLSFRVPFLVGEPVAFMGAEYETTRLAIKNKKFDPKKLQEDLVLSAEDALATPTTKLDYEPRMRALRKFVKGLNSKAAKEVYPPAMQAKLRMTYAQDPKEGCRLLDTLLQKAYEYLKANQNRR